MKNTLDLYERTMAKGRLSVDGLLRVVKVGFEALIRGRIDYFERERRRKELEEREWDEMITQTQMNSQNSNGSVSGSGEEKKRGDNYKR